MFVASRPQLLLCGQHTHHIKMVANQLDVRCVLRRIGFQPILCIVSNVSCVCVL